MTDTEGGAPSGDRNGQRAGADDANIQSPDRDAAGLPHDDEQANQQQIARTGEPQRDASGNADGAS